MQSTQQIQQAEQGSVQHKITERAVHTFNVLLVEDTLSQTALVKRLLNKSDRATFCITSVRTLSEAIISVAQAQFDVILLDLGLPDSTGLNTLTRMFEFSATTPIVVFTADSEESLGMELIRRGAQDYVEKSGVDSASLVRAITYAAERRKLADKLVETQKIFVAFMENNPAAAFVVTESGEKLYSNEQFERSFTAAVSNDAIAGDILVRRTRHEDLHILRAGTPIETIERVPDPEGKTKNWLVVKFPFLDVNGRRLIGGTAVDVTELERSREAVRQTREMFQVMFYHSNVPQAIVGPNFVFRRVNNAYCDLLGYTEDELLGRQLKELTLPEDWHAARNILLTPSQLHRSTTRLIHKSGNRITVARVGTVILDAQDTPLFAAIVDHPVADCPPREPDRQSADAELILQSCPLPAFVTDKSSRVTRANPIFFDLLQMDKTCGFEVVGSLLEITSRTPSSAVSGYAHNVELWEVTYVTMHGGRRCRNWKVAQWNAVLSSGEQTDTVNVILAEYAAGTQ